MSLLGSDCTKPIDWVILFINKISLDSGIINYLKISNEEPKYTRYVTVIELIIYY
jgi:hypothetical protein